MFTYPLGLYPLQLSYRISSAFAFAGYTMDIKQEGEKMDVNI